MKNFAIVIGILSLVAGYAKAAVVTTGQVLATRADQVTDTSIFKVDKRVAHVAISNQDEKVTAMSILKRDESRLVQERDYTVPTLKETENKLARHSDLIHRGNLIELPYKYMVGLIGKLITCMNKCGKTYERLFRKGKFRYAYCLSECVDFKLHLRGIFRSHYIKEYVRIIGENKFPEEPAEQPRPAGGIH